MAASPTAARLLEGGIVPIDPESARVRRTLALPSREPLPRNALRQPGRPEILPPEAHNDHVKRCDPFLSMPIAAPLPLARNTSTTGGEA